MQYIDREGTFRGPCHAANIVTGSEGSSTVGIDLTYAIEEMLSPSNEWEDWRQYEVFARGTLWIIKKDGTINNVAAETARDVLGWNGDIDNIGPDSFKPAQVVVKIDQYKDQTRYRIAFFNPFNSLGPAKRLDDNAIRSIKTQHGSKLRAFFGSAPKPSTAPKPAGKPMAPPAAKSAPPAPASTATMELLAATREEAWAYIVKTWENRDDVDPAKQWAEAVAKVGKKAGREEPDFLSEHWSEVAFIGSLPF